MLTTIKKTQIIPTSRILARLFAKILTKIIIILTNV